MEQICAKEERPLILGYLKDLQAKAHEDYVQGRMPNEWVSHHLKGLGDFFKKNHGWSPVSAKRKVVAVIKELQESGKVEAVFDGRGSLKRVKILSLEEKASFTAKVVLRKKGTEPTFVLLIEAPKVEIPASLKAKMDAIAKVNERHHAKILRRAEKLKAQVLAEEEKALEKGRESENRCRMAAAKLAWAINQIPALELNAEFDYTGTGDKRDREGEDVSIYIGSRTDKFWFIWDAKSSRANAKNYNDNIYFTKHQREASLKKAIVTHKRRPFLEIIEEMFEDLVEGGLSQLIAHKTAIFEKIESAA